MDSMVPKDFKLVIPRKYNVKYSKKYMEPDTLRPDNWKFILSLYTLIFVIISVYNLYLSDILFTPIILSAPIEYRLALIFLFGALFQGILLAILILFLQKSKIRKEQIGINKIEWKKSVTLGFFSTGAAAISFLLLILFFKYIKMMKYLLHLIQK